MVPCIVGHLNEISNYQNPMATYVNLWQKNKINAIDDSGFTGTHFKYCKIDIITFMLDCIIDG